MRTLLFLIVLVGLVGCGDGYPKRVPVSGTVTFEGKPLANANITFLTSVEDGMSASGKTDDAGKYTLTSYTPDDGAIPGEYSITINMIDDRAADVDASSSEGDFGADYGKMMDESASSVAPAQAGGLPAKYAVAGKSGLKKTVQEGSENVFDLDLD